LSVTLQFKDVLAGEMQMAKRSPKGTSMLRSREAELRELLDGINARFSDHSLKRLMAAIQNNQPIDPPDGEGWDVGASLLTMMVLAMRVTALMKAKTPVRKPRQRSRRSRRIK
jgi:hypothetical protein